MKHRYLRTVWFLGTAFVSYAQQMASALQKLYGSTGGGEPHKNEVLAGGLQENTLHQNHTKSNHWVIPYSKIVVCCLFILMFQPCTAQHNATDSMLKNSALYQRGKKNVTSGGILVGTALFGGLIASAMKEKESTNGFRFAPTGKEMVYFLSGTLGFIGILKLIQGGIRMKRARAEMSAVSYEQLPGQQAQMPTVTIRWPLGQRKNKPALTGSISPKY